MRRFLLALVFALAAAVSVEAATITITTTAEQDEALQALRRKLNKDRTPPLTAAEFRAYLVSQWLDGLVSQAGEETRTTVREAYQSAPQATKDQVRTLLGVQ